MLDKLLTTIFGSKHERDIKRIQPIVSQINQYYQQYHELSDDELRYKTIEFKNLIQERIENIRQEIEQLYSQLRQDTTDAKGTDFEEVRTQISELEDEEKEIMEGVLLEILPRAFAVVKEQCRRLVGKSWGVSDIQAVWDMVPFDVQLVGGIVLHEGKIAEMATGEGKTLVASMPLYLNALPGRGAHLVTVNDYLAKRDCEWMGKIYETLGLTYAYITNEMDPPQRQRAYNSDITYGTNNEFGFDYLRDNMAIRVEDLVQRQHNYAIIDEVDSVLIDEARTPLIISGPVAKSTQQFDVVKPHVSQLARLQTNLVNRLIAEAEKLLQSDDTYEAGIRLLKASRGAPKNKRLLKILREVGVKKLIQRVENDYLRDKRLHELDEELYYSIDEKSNVIDLTDKGREALSPNDPELFILPDLATELSQIDQNPELSPEKKAEEKNRVQVEYAEKSERLHNIQQLLKAYSLFEKDVEYVVTDGKVMIVDEFTGRLMPGRRYSDGLHQAIEAKEGVKIEGETQTLATITLQNFFRLYNKLAGMTGTAETEAHEFWEIYKLDVVVIPTNEPIRRMDYQDQIFRTKREKYNAVIDEIEEMHKKNRPALVGTISVEVSETLSRMLKRRGIKHNVLNAKHHKEEAQIVRKAGQPGMVTIATNMAGRGTDIKLGKGVVLCDGGCYLVDDNGRPVPPNINLSECEASMPCGLHIIGTERHESRRIDRQLRGRSGRQGDPGSTRFYLSLEDDLMRLFGSERIAGVMDRLGIQDGEVITHSMITRSIEKAQKRVEMHNFDIRKHLLEYDDVMNQQREVIYKLRANALHGENLRSQILDMIDQIIEDRIAHRAGGSKYPEEWDWAGLNNDFQRFFLMPPIFSKKEDIPSDLTTEELFEMVQEKAQQGYFQKEKLIGEKTMRKLERIALLQVIDTNWREHLYEMDQIKEGIGLRAYGQKDPLIEYKSEGFNAFADMLAQVNEGVIELIFKYQLREEPITITGRRPVQMQEVHDSATGLGFQPTAQAPSQNQQAAPGGQPAQGKKKPIVVGPKIGRNDPCPCGSGKKYKKCHGANK
ncbi:MAG: preprotein translocase subunit SecA [Calditrichaeota bacterium]|nr:preprotein translocase subunit SecA [Calditrichota bacterium]